MNCAFSKPSNSIYKKIVGKGNSNVSLKKSKNKKVETEIEKQNGGGIVPAGHREARRNWRKAERMDGQTSTAPRNEGIERMRIANRPDAPGTPRRRARRHPTIAYQ